VTGADRAARVLAEDLLSVAVPPDADGGALRPGVVVRLAAGDRTTWELTGRLRKLYLALG
jgi:hypothetical protein